MNNDISIIILTSNEILHIERAIKNALLLTKYIYVVDSFSTDGTIEIAESMGIEVHQYNWTDSSNFSKKINWALDNLPIKTKWLIRLDADEYFLEETLVNLPGLLANVGDDINGLTLNRRIFFLGNWIKYGGQYPRSPVRIFRNGFVRYEHRLLDEYVMVDNNKILNLSLDFVDDNLNNISNWILKHDKYSILEALEMIHQELGLFERENSANNIGEIGLLVKKNKTLYSRMPLYWRAFFYFLYRYIVKRGFLDGIPGFLWNFLQGWWYRTVVDVKISEIKKECGTDIELIKLHVWNRHGIKI